MSTAYLYNTELAHVFSNDIHMNSGSASRLDMMTRSIGMKQQQHRQHQQHQQLQAPMWLDENLLRGSMGEPSLLPAMDLHPLNLKKDIQYPKFSEPNSVLDMHMAASPGSSPTRSSVYGSPDSSARSVHPFSRQQSFSSAYSDSPRSIVSYPEERRTERTPFSGGALFPSNCNVGSLGSDLTRSWVDCLSDPHDQVLDLSVLDCGPDLVTANSNGQDLDGSGSVEQDLHNFCSGNLDLSGFESIMMLSEPDDHDMLADDPLSQILNGQEKVNGTFSQNLDSDHDFKFENFNSLENLDPGSIDVRSFNHTTKGVFDVQEQCRSFPGFQQQPQPQPRQEIVAQQPPPQEETGLYLVQLLLGCAEAIEKGDYKSASSMSSRLSELASPYGDAMQRIAVYFGEALTDRLDNAIIADNTYVHTTLASSLAKTKGDSFTPLSLDSHVAYQAFYQVLPYVKFAHFTANQAILEAVGGDDRIHLVDLNIGQGLQWPSFIQSLALRDHSKHLNLKITGVGPDLAILQQTGKRLCEFAASLQVAVEYHAVEERCLDNLDAGILHVHHGESLAVSCGNVLNSLLGNQRALKALLRMLNGLNPRVIAVVEVESNNNSPSFLSRFVEALHHYSALFDCLEATLGRSSVERLRIEKLCLASTIKDILTGERCNRNTRHVRTETWQTFFRQAGCRDLPLSAYASYQAKLLLGLYNGAYKLTAEGAALNLGWQDTPIVTVSAWTCN